MMLARILERHAADLRAATTDADVLAALSLAFGTPFGAQWDNHGWLEFKGSYRGGTVRAPWCRYSADSGETWTEYRGKTLAALVRSILGTDAQADLFPVPTARRVA